MRYQLTSEHCFRAVPFRDLHTTYEESYSMLFKVENLKLLPGYYKVSIGERQVAQFEQKTLSVT